MMKKIIGVFVLLVWITLFFYYFDMIMPKGILYIVVGFPIALMTTLFIMKKSGFKV